MYSSYCYVLEDAQGIVGYIVASPDVREYQERLMKDWLPKLRSLYPKSAKEAMSPAEVCI
jgi:hypothetical protein